MRYLTFLFAVFSTLPLAGQMSFDIDTVKIEEVVISSDKGGQMQPGYKTTKLDTVVLTNNLNKSLADLLAENTTVFIKSYGMGGTASPSFRGTGAGHTQVTWNDINIGNPMPGQSDLSLIPSGLIDDISIYFGGASMSLNSGGIGGVINLETKPVWNDQISVTLSPWLGSFGQFGGLAKIKTGNTKFQSVSKLLYQVAENNFPYIDNVSGSEPVRQFRSDSETEQYGLMQELYYRHKRSITSLRFWYEAADRNLPSSLLTMQSSLRETQSDQSFRAMIDHDLSAGNTDYSFTGAWMTNLLEYTNSLAGIDSRNNSGTMIIKAAMRRALTGFTTLHIMLNEELDIISSNNYDAKKERNTASFTASLERETGRRISSSILLREILHSGTLLIPDFSAGLQYRLAEEKEFFIKGNISRNSKIPSMNDMYWLPGGNSDLKNEYAYIYELTSEFKHRIGQPFNLKYDVTLYRNDIHDMIQWHPGEFSYWTADNIKRVRSAGLEGALSANYSISRFSAGIDACYSYTKAISLNSGNENDNSYGKQLVYVPENQANCSVNLKYGILYTSWLTSFTGKRYLTADNTAYLDGFCVNNLLAGARINLNSTSLDVNFRIDNILDEEYQTIAYYPLPGRSYSLKLIFQFDK